MFHKSKFFKKTARAVVMLVVSGNALMAQIFQTPLPNSTTLTTVIGPNSDAATVVFSGNASSACVPNTSAGVPFTVSVTGTGFTALTYQWSVSGGVSLVSSSGNTATAKPVFVANKEYAPGVLSVKWQAVKDTTVTVPIPCGTGTTTYTYQLTKKGSASVNLYQKFTTSSLIKIVGPTCVSPNEEVTFSIKPVVSSANGPNDKYKWNYISTTGNTLPGDPVEYTSPDYSSTTVKLKSAALTYPFSLKANIGICNQAATDEKVLVFGQKMAKPVAAIATYPKASTCVPLSASTVSLSVTGVDNTNIAYSWTTDIPNATPVGGVWNVANLTLNIGGGTGNIYLTAKPKTTVFCSSNNQPLYDTIKITRAMTGATISGPSCVKVGQTYTYSLRITGKRYSGPTLGIWTVPTGMTIVGANNDSTLTVNIASVVNNGTVTAKFATAGTCTSTATLTGITTSPYVTAIGGLACVNPNTTSNYTATLATNTTATSYAWSFTGGLSSSSTTITAGVSVPTGFTSGTITVTPNKTGCPASDAFFITVKANPVMTKPVASQTCLNSNMADTVSFTAASGYDVYSWNTPAGWVVQSGAGSQVITYITNGSTDSVRVTGTITGCGASISKGVFVPTSGVGIALTLQKVNQGAQDLLIANYMTGVNYTWIKDGVDIPNSNNSVLTVNVINGPTHTYTFRAQSPSLGCSSTSASSVSSIYSNARMASDEDINTTEAASLNVSPNPTNTEFTMSLAGMAGADVRIIEQATGKEVKRFTASSNVINVPTATWAAGVYVVTATSGTNRLVKSVVISH